MAFKYLPEAVVVVANQFDELVGGYITTLARFGVVAVPQKKTALFNEFCDVNDLPVAQNRKGTLVLAESLEPNLITMLY